MEWALTAAALAAVVCAVLAVRQWRCAGRARAELAALRAVHEERVRRPGVLFH